MMSLQELRGTLFSYLQPRLNSFLGAQEHEIPILGSDDDIIINIYKNYRDIQVLDERAAYYGDPSHVTSFKFPNASVKESIDVELQSVDPYIMTILGGKRGTECEQNHNGPCTSKELTSLGNNQPIAPAFEFDLKGEDPTFLGGWLSDDAPFGQHYNSIITERDDFKVENAELKATKEALENEKSELQALAEAQDSSSNSDVQVFPFVNWARANKSKTWYKDVDWSAIPFNRLSDDEKESLDWSKINYAEAIDSDTFKYDLIDWNDISAASKKIKKKIYKSINWGNFDFDSLDASDKFDWANVNFKQAQSSDSFDILDLAWDQINGLSRKSKKKVYNKIDWRIDFTSMNLGDSDVFDWSFVDMKNIHWSPGFILDVVEIDEIKGKKNFNQLAKELQKESSWSDRYLAEASDQILQEIGYENFVGKITDKMRQEFATDNGDKYTFVMKPLAYERADAVARAMGGQLANIEVNESSSFVDKLTGILAQKSVSNNLTQTEANDVSAAWFGDSATHNTSAYNAIKLADIVGSGIEDLASAYNTNSLWFIVENPPISGNSSVVVP